jgi:fatty acid desaturase
MKSEKRRLTPWTALVFAGLAIWVLDLILMGWRLWLWFWFEFLVGYSIGIVFHELGHLTFAAIGSIPVYQIRIGAGPLLWRSRFGDTWLELRVLPLSGGGPSSLTRL